MFGLTSLGAVHTAISLVALAAGIVSLVRGGRITAGNGLGRVYVWTTALTCLTGFGIFQRGGFGAPHMLGIITLVVLAIAVALERRAWLGRASAYVATVSFSLTFFFHLIPGTTETFTRFPLGAPLFAGPDDPALQKVVGILFALFVLGAAWQVWRLRAARHEIEPAVPFAPS